MSAARKIGREQRRLAADYCETLRVVEAAVAVPPAVLERLEEIERRHDEQTRVIEHLQARVEALEGRPETSERQEVSEDGDPMPRGSWHPIKAATSMAGFASGTSLRKHIAKAKRDGALAWWWFRQGRLWVDLDRAPRKRR
jgi:hypothetical protein